MSRAKKFYESVLNRKLEKLDSPEIEMWSFSGDMSSDGAPGALVKMTGFPSGGKIQKQKFSIGKYGYISLVFDTEGNIFGLHSLK